MGLYLEFVEADGEVGHLDAKKAFRIGRKNNKLSLSFDGAHFKLFVEYENSDLAKYVYVSAIEMLRLGVDGLINAEGDIWVGGRRIWGIAKGLNPHKVLEEVKFGKKSRALAARKHAAEDEAPAEDAGRKHASRSSGRGPASRYEGDGSVENPLRRKGQPSIRWPKRLYSSNKTGRKVAPKEKRRN